MHHCGAPARDRILVVGNPYLGDTILALPFLRNLRAAFPGHGIDLLAEGGAVGRLLEGCPWVDEVLRWERPARAAGGRPLRATFESLAACAATLRARRYARAYILKRSTSSALLAARAGIPRRVGHARGPASLLLTRAVRLDRDRHYADGLLDLLRADGVAVDDGHAGHWGASATALSRVDALLARLPAARPRLFVAVRSTDGRRQWPLDRWVDALRRIVGEHAAEIVFCGGPDDGPALAALVADMGPAGAHVHDLSAAVPLADVAALLGRMDAFLGVNSGLMHVAASCGTPTVAIFDAADVRKWRPRGADHAILCGSSDRPATSAPPVAGAWASGTAVRAVTVEQVVAATARFLATRSPLRAVDLTVGSHRYEVLVRSATPAAAVPAAG